MKAFILAVMFFFLFGSVALAQESLEIDTVTPTPASEVVYTLPYPGILPDNPLYVLKATRDRIVSFFISDPIKKAEFDLLQADKRVQAGLFLLQKKDPDEELAISTISKGQNYLHESLSGIETVIQKDIASDDASAVALGNLPDKIYNASRKHNQLLQKEGERLEGQSAQDFRLLLRRSEGYIHQAKKLHDKQ